MRCRRRSSPRRILFAVPAIAFARLIIYYGGWMFARRDRVLGLVAVHELSVMLERAHPVRLASMLGVLGMIAAGTAGDEGTVLMALAAFVPVTFWLAVAMPQRERITASMSVTLLTSSGSASALARGAAARARPRRRARAHGPARHLPGRHRRLPRRPRVRTAQARAADLAQQDHRRARDRRGVLHAVVWYWSRTYDGDWISGTDGLLLGVAVAIAAPTGDLFESLIKRDMGTKDTGTLFGRPRRRARPPRRRAVRARRRLLRMDRRGIDDEDEQRDRQMLELLNELRVALPGVQILFAFLLTVPFSSASRRSPRRRRTSISGR